MSKMGWKIKKRLTWTFEIENGKQLWKRIKRQFYVYVGIKKGLKLRVMRGNR